MYSKNTAHTTLHIRIRSRSSIKDNVTFICAIANGIYSTITSLCRQMLVLLPAAYLLSLTGEVTNVWWAYPIAEVMSLTVTMIFFLRIYRQKIKPLQIG